MAEFDEMGQDARDELRVEFYRDSTTPERREEILVLVQGGADEAKMGRGPCPRCKHYPFMIPHTHAIIEGHVYSDEGLREVGITGYCEFCFDIITTPPDEDDDTWKQEAIAGDIQAMANAMGPDVTVRVLSDDEVRDLLAGPEF